MKKLRLAISLLMTLIITFTLTACGGDSGQQEPEFTLQLSKVTGSVNINESFALSAYLSIEGKTVIWSSSDTAKATVKANDNPNTATVTGVGVGSATITATVGNKTATCAVTITNPTLGYTEISTPEQFKNIKNKLNGKYVLKNDIDFAKEKIAPMGSWPDALFIGTLDGNGFAIKNGIIDEQPTIDRDGLFFRASLFVGIGDTGTVKNLNILNFVAVADGFSGVIAGANRGNISNCYVDSFVENTLGWTHDIPGGVLVGINENLGTIKNCLVNSIVGTGTYPLVGWNFGNVENSYVVDAKIFDTSIALTAPPNQANDTKYCKPLIDCSALTKEGLVNKVIYVGFSEAVWVLEDNKLPTLKSSVVREYSNLGLIDSELTLTEKQENFRYAVLAGHEYTLGKITLEPIEGKTIDERLANILIAYNLLSDSEKNNSIIKYANSVYEIKKSQYETLKAADTANVQGFISAVENIGTVGEMLTPGKLKAAYDFYDKISSRLKTSSNVATAKIIYDEKKYEYENIRTGYVAINSVTDFKNIKNNVNGKYYLTKDLDFDGTTLDPILAFNGIFNGNGYSLKNVTLNNIDALKDTNGKDEEGNTVTAYFKVGIFSMISASAIVRNVAVINLTNNCSGFGSALVSENAGLVENCYIENANVVCDLGWKWWVPGGLITAINGFTGKVIGCFVKSNVGDGVFPIAGYNYGDISFCYAASDYIIQAPGSSEMIALSNKGHAAPRFSRYLDNEEIKISGNFVGFSSSAWDFTGETPTLKNR